MIVDIELMQIYSSVSPKRDRNSKVQCLWSPTGNPVASCLPSGRPSDTLAGPAPSQAGGRNLKQEPPAKARAQVDGVIRVV